MDLDTKSGTFYKYIYIKTVLQQGQTMFLIP